MFSTSLLMLLLLLLGWNDGNLFAFEMKRVRIGVDYGPRFIGIAYSDIFGQVHPLYKVIHNRNNLTEISEQIFKIAKYRSASEIIVGIPLRGRTDGNIQRRVTEFNGQLCLNFSKVLQSVVQYRSNSRLKVRLYDERFTTSEAKLKVASRNSKERYLEDEGQGSLLAPACPYPPPKDLEYFDYNLVKCHVRKLYYQQFDGDKELLKTMPKLDDSLLDDNLIDYGEKEELSEKVLQQYEDYYAPFNIMKRDTAGMEAEAEVDNTIEENNEDNDEETEYEDDEEEKEEEIFLPPPSFRLRPKGTLKNPWWLKDTPKK